MKVHWTRTILEDATDDNGHLMVDQEELDRRLEAKLAEDARVTAERVDIRAEAAWRQIMMDDWTEMPKRFRQANRCVASPVLETCQYLVASVPMRWAIFGCPAVGSYIPSMQTLFGD